MRINIPQMSVSNWLKQSPTVKFAIIGILVLILLIPATFVNELIRDRSNLQEDAIREIGEKWGRSQTIGGPVISVPYKTTVSNTQGEQTPALAYLHIMPDLLSVKGNIKPEVRYRGIYEAVVYNAGLQFSGKFTRPEQIKIPDVKPENIMWNEAFVAVGLSDLKGIKNAVRIKLNGTETEALPGIETNDLFNDGMAAKIDLQADSAKTIDFSFELSLNGSEYIDFIPVGRETKVNISSPWTKPSFTGEYLPDSKDISASGFSANWNVLYINRPFPQVWAGNSHNLNESAFGVNLLEKINGYDMAKRSSKYAIMFLALTFLAFFLTEALSKTKIHIIQYVLVGFSLCTFYLLLLSLSEQIGFNWAYLLASVAIILQITFYANTFVKHRKHSLAVSAVLAALYGFLFITLQSEDYSLLIGSLALFIILSLTMYLSRKINWGNIQLANAPETPQTNENTPQ